jgi:hypothetical protein
MLDVDEDASDRPDVRDSRLVERERAEARCRVGFRRGEDGVGATFPHFGKRQFDVMIAEQHGDSVLGRIEESSQRAKDGVLVRRHDARHLLSGFLAIDAQVPRLQLQEIDEVAVDDDLNDARPCPNRLDKGDQRFRLPSPGKDVEIVTFAEMQIADDDDGFAHVLNALPQEISSRQFDPYAAVSQPLKAVVGAHELFRGPLQRMFVRNRLTKRRSIEIRYLHRVKRRLLSFHLCSQNVQLR